MNKKKRLYSIATIVCFLIAFGFGLYAFKEYLPVLNSHISMRKIKNDHVQGKQDGDPFQRKIDFDGLQGINSDIKAWIYIPGTTIDYPVLRGKETTTYLWRDINGNYSEIGSLFTDAREGDIFNEANPFIYGHTMNMFEMFGELKMYLIQQEYRHEKRDAYIYTPDQTYHVQLYSILAVKANNHVFEHLFPVASKEYENRIQEYRDANQFMDIPTPHVKNQWKKKKTFTLSTCLGDVGTDERTLLNWIEVEKKNVK